MSAPSEMTARHAATLAELAEIGMVIARDLQTEVQTAATPEAKARAVAAFPRVARAVRQCLALEAKFARDAAQAERETALEVVRERDTRRGRRKLQVRVRIERILNDRYGTDSPDITDEHDAWLTDLRDCLHEDVLDPEVLDQPFEVVFARICADLGLTPPGGDDEEDDEDPDDEAPDDEPSGPVKVYRPGPDDIEFDACPPVEPDVRHSNSS